MILKFFIKTKVKSPEMETEKGAKNTLDNHHVKTLAQLKIQDQEDFARFLKTKKAESQTVTSLYWGYVEKMRRTNLTIGQDQN